MRGNRRSTVIGAVFLLGQWFLAAAALGLTISPSPSPNGSYTVTWTAPSTSSIKTRLYEKVGSSAWSTVGTYASSVSSKGFSGAVTSTSIRRLTNGTDGTRTR